ncbi:MAG: protein kinase domain-containing protein [Planctomycetota bacterium]|jgi:serine/threonine protein kinase/WD40 repeat protein
MAQPSKDIKLIFAEALEKQTSGERAAYLDAACGRDAELLKKVEALLAAYEEADDVPDSPIIDLGATMEDMTLVEQPGTAIGRYKLLEKIGEGGFGAVWAAEQKKPVKRRVALKIIKLGMDTRQVVARFEAERQALALMDHPNIAKVLDAGATDTGRPYFVMELVKGIPIIEYCDQVKLPIQDRLDLFIKVCNAIQHAHQKGIIHRDIKPSNILITLHDGVPVPRIIDFGIAKAAQQELTEMTIYTQHHQFIGTPAYMSPEQAEMSGLDIDTRSDIYSLGVLLYGLLTGRTPFDERELMHSGIDQMRKIIREKEPQRPSTKFATLQMDEQSTTAARHSTDSPRLISLLRGDLDWIVMKCLEKDRTRRYETANGLALDVVRHMRNEPVIARPPTVIYQLQKAWRRNKVVYTAAGIVAASLIIGISVSVWQAWVATGARADAEAASEREYKQRLQSDADREKAVQAERKARESEVNALRRAYNSDMSLAFRALEEDLFGSVRESVRQHIPEHEAPDFRGWEWRYAWALFQSDAVHAWDAIDDTNEVYAVRISPDQRYLASSEFDYGPAPGRYIRRLWDFRTREEQKHVLLPGGSARGFAFSNSGKYLALHCDRGNGEHEIQIYSTATWRPENKIRLDRWISRLSFSPDDKMLATVGSLEAVLWDWRQPPERAKIHDWPIVGAGGSYSDVVFFRKNPWLAIGGTKELKIVDTHTYKIEYEQPVPTMGITALAISPDESYVAIGFGFEVSEIGLLKNASPDSNGWKQEPNLVGHSRWVSSLTFSEKNGPRLISSSADSTIRVWDMNSRDTTRVLKGHQSGVYSVSLTLDESGAVSAGPGQILEWNLDVPLSEYREHLLDEPVRQVVFSADSRAFYTINDKGSVCIWDAKTLNKKPWSSPELGEKSSILLSPDGKHLIAGTGSGDLLVLDVRDLREVAHEPNAAPGRILPVGFSADDKSLVALESDHKISLWNVDTWEFIDRVPIRPKVDYLYIENYCAISPRSDMFLYPSGADLVGWDLKQAKKQTTVRVNPGRAGGIAFSPTEPLLASTAREGGGSIFLWNWETRQKAGRPLRGTRALHSVAFSPDGRRLVTSSNGKGAVMLWDVSTGQEIARFGRSVARILNTVQFSPDGNTICAVDIGGTAYFWRAPSWDEINALEAEQHEKAESL